MRQMAAMLALCWFVWISSGVWAQGPGANAVQRSFAPEPRFGMRPESSGFRPSTSGERPRLLRRGSGLYDAMEAARANPLQIGGLDPVLPPQPQPDRELFETLQVLRNSQAQLARQRAAESARTQRSRPRIPYRIGTSLPRPDAPDLPVMEQRLQNQFQELGHGASGIRLSAKGNAVIIEGTVSSPRARRLVEHLVRFEPGVYEVENRLHVLTETESL